MTSQIGLSKFAPDKIKIHIICHGKEKAMPFVCNGNRQEEYFMPDLRIRIPSSQDRLSLDGYFTDIVNFAFFNFLDGILKYPKLIRL